MYNEEVKRKFLEWYYQGHKQNSQHLRYFEIVQPFEESVGKDISEFQKEDARDCLVSLGVSSAGSMRNIISFFRQYEKWCVDNNVFENVHCGFCMLSVRDVDMSPSFSEVYFKDEDDFLQSLHAIREFDNGYPDVPYFIFSWLGLSKEYAVSVRESDVDLEDKVIYCPDGSICAMGFSDKIRDILQAFKDCKMGTRGTRTGYRTVYKDRSADVFIKRFLPRGTKNVENYGKPYTVSQMNGQINKYKTIDISEALLRKFTYQNVAKSGALFRLYIAEKSGVNVLASENKKLMLLVNNSEAGKSNLSKDYIEYKKAFNLS